GPDHVVTVIDVFGLRAQPMERLQSTRVAKRTERPDGVSVQRIAQDRETKIYQLARVASTWSPRLDLVEFDAGMILAIRHSRLARDHRLDVYEHIWPSPRRRLWLGRRVEIVLIRRVPFLPLFANLRFVLQSESAHARRLSGQ